MANLFADGFEDGTINAWTISKTDGGNLSVTTAAKLHGNYGLSCLINDTNELTISKVIGSSSSRCRFRFYLDPNTVSMTNGSFFKIFQGMGSGWGNVIEIKLRKDAGGYYLSIQDYTDGTWSTYGTYSYISDAPHCIEVDWKASSAPLANDGYITMWIDGTSALDLTGIDNDTETIGIFRLGAYVFSGTNSGTIYLDDFASNNDGSEIGLIVEGEVKNASGKAELISNLGILLNRGKIENISGKAELTSSINIILQRGKIENASGKANLTSLIEAVLSRGKIEDVSGKAILNSSINISINRGRIENASGKAELTSLIDLVLSRGKIESVSAKAEMQTSVMVKVSRITSVSGKAILESSIEIDLNKLAKKNTSGKAELNSLLNILLKRGELINSSGKANLTSNIVSFLSRGRIENAIGKAELKTSVEVFVRCVGKRRATGKAHLTTNIEIELTIKYAFTEAILGIKSNESILGIKSNESILGIKSNESILDIKE